MTMTLMLTDKQILKELEFMQSIKTLTWKDIISQRLEDNLSAYEKDVDYIVRSLSVKNPLTILRRLS